MAVRRFGVAEGVPCGAEQAVRAGRGGEDGGERRDLGEDRGHEQRPPPVAGHEQVQAPFPPGPQRLVHGPDPQFDADAGGGGGRVERGCPAVQPPGAAQRALRRGQPGDLRGQRPGRVVAAGVGRAGPVPVPGAQVLVVSEQPPHRAALVPGGAAGAGPLGEVAQGQPVRFRHPQLGQRQGQVPGRVAGHRRQPGRQAGHAAVGGGPADAKMSAQVAGVQAVDGGEAVQPGGDGLVLGGGSRDGSRRQVLTSWPGVRRPDAGALRGVVDGNQVEQVPGDLLGAVLDGQDRRAAHELGQAADHAAGAAEQVLAQPGQRAGLVVRAGAGWLPWRRSGSARFLSAL